MVTVRGPNALLFVVEVLKVEPEPAPTLNHGTADRIVLERKLSQGTVIRTLAMVREHATNNLFIIPALTFMPISLFEALKEFDFRAINNG